MKGKLFSRISEFVDRNPMSGAVIAFCIFLLLALLSFTGLYQIFELKLYDFRFQLKPQIEEWNRLVFVDMDENSIIAIGSFPWQRRVYAKAMDSLRQVGAAQLTLDVIFPDRSPRQIDEEAYHDSAIRGKKGGKAFLDTVIVDNDKVFAGGIARLGKVVIPYNFMTQKLTRELIELYSTDRFKKARERFINLSSVQVPEKERHKYKEIENINITTIEYPIPDIMETAHAFGFVDRDSDDDGTLRRIRLVRYWDGRLYFNLGIAMLLDMCNISMKDIIVAPGDSITLKNALNPVTHEKGDIVIPVDREGMMIINWAGPGPRTKSFRCISFYTLIDYFDFVNNNEVNVYDIFDELGAGGGNAALAVINDSIDSLRKKYEETGSPAEKRKIWDSITGEQKKLSETKMAMLKFIDDEIGMVKKELKKNNNPEYRAILDQLVTHKEACQVVILAESLKDSYVVSGLTGTSSHDLATIPTATDYDRVGIYFNMINTIFQGAYIRKVGSAMNLLLMLVIALVMGFVIQRLHARTSIVVIAVSLFGLTVIIIALFAFGNIWVDQLGLTLAMLVPSMTIGSIKFLNEERQKRFIKNAFSHYLAPGVIEQIIQNPESLVLGGESREITIFFSDVASFSSISEKLTPPQLVTLLNEYLSEMTDIILSYDGTVDKYEGDAIMAFYGAPRHFDDHPLKACLASIDMKRRLRDLQDQWRAIGKDALSARMGINTGIAVVGNMGSKTRMNYTVMGDSVNLASRLEGANKFYKTNAMISGSTYEKVKDQVEARKLDVIRVVGKQESVEIYELLGRKGTLPDRMYDMMDKYNQGLEYFNLRDWKKARALFKQGLQAVDDDGPSMTYMDRCAEFIKQSPPKNWDGVYTLKSK